MAKSLLFKAGYRNKLEREIARQLEEAGVPFAFEGRRIPYDVPARVAKYLPDFEINNGIILEGKGWFGRNGAKERQKFVLLKQQHPHLDIRFVFSDAKKPLDKGSKTTYAEWADENGFKYSTKGVIPASWLREMKRKRKPTTTDTDA
jgi:hypothetical protein